MARGGPPAAVPSLNYITSLAATDEAVMVLAAPSEGHPRSLLRLDAASGRVLAHYQIGEPEPTFWQMAADPVRNVLYLTAPEMGRVYRLRVSKLEER
jgi:hypothetical protein